MLCFNMCASVCVCLYVPCIRYINLESPGFDDLNLMYYYLLCKIAEMLSGIGYLLYHNIVEIVFCLIYWSMLMPKQTNEFCHVSCYLNWKQFASRDVPPRHPMSYDLNIWKFCLLSLSLF